MKKFVLVICLVFSLSLTPAANVFAATGGELPHTVISEGPDAQYEAMNNPVLDTFIDKNTGLTFDYPEGWSIEVRNIVKYDRTYPAKRISSARKITITSESGRYRVTFSEIKTLGETCFLVNAISNYGHGNYTNSNDVVDNNYVYMLFKDGIVFTDSYEFDNGVYGSSYQGWDMIYASRLVASAKIINLAK